MDLSKDNLKNTEFWNSINVVLPKYDIDKVKEILISESNRSYNGCSHMASCRRRKYLQSFYRKDQPETFEPGSC